MVTPTQPRVTFGIIVLNGEPFTRYTLRALYPFAYQIVVVEGACPSAARVATPDGHSRDGTLETLRRFKAEEDPDGKLTIVTAEDAGSLNGFWPEKDEMSQAYAQRTTGDYLWQIDIDEFYRPQDMRAVLELLQRDRTITAATFRVLTFWGGLDYRTDGFYLQSGAQDFHRLFAWGAGYRYITHRPPTVVNEQGRDLRKINPLTAAHLAQMDIYMHHYELLFPKQVREKCSYYAGASWTDALRDAEQWVQECYLEIKHPFRTHMVYEYPSWLEHYRGEHHPQVVTMVDAVRSDEHPGIELRATTDIEALLAQPEYRVRRAAMKARLPVERTLLQARAHAIRIARRTPLWPMLKRARAKLRGHTHQSVSTDYAQISQESVLPEFANAWRDPSIAPAQRRLVDEELARMYRGDVIAPYRVLANAITLTGEARGRIIEIGCGSGYYYEILRHLLGHDISYLGVDYSKALIADAIHHYPLMHFEVGDATALPLEDSSGEILISGGVLLHVKDYATVIAESARVSRKWVIFHRTPVSSGPTSYYTKRAYGVQCMEILFGEGELFELFKENSLELVSTLEIADGMRTYVCRK